MSGQCDYCSSNPCACWIDDIDSNVSTDRHAYTELLEGNVKLEQQLEQSQEREQKLKEALKYYADQIRSCARARAVLKELYKENNNEFITRE